MKKLYIETYGCQMNVADSEVVASVMQMAGYEVTDNAEEADAVFLNTCSVRDNAEQKIYHRLDALDAINSNQMYRQIYDSYLSQTNDMRRSYELTKKQEDAGLIGVTDLLSVEETYLSSEMNLSTARKNELDAVVDLAKALGGGWTAQDIQAAEKK